MLCRRSKLTALLCAFVLLVTLLIPSNAAAVTIGVQDTDVSNSASFSTDTIYQIVTDRFFDGDSSNNPTGDIFDITNPRKYHGGDWKGITQKINDGYLTGMGITANLSTIICSQREPASWSSMILNDEVSSNAIMKRATRHYTVVIKPLNNG